MWPQEVFFSQAPLQAVSNFLGHYTRYAVAQTQDAGRVLVGGEEIVPHWEEVRWEAHTRQAQGKALWAVQDQEGLQAAMHPQRRGSRHIWTYGVCRVIF